MSERFEPKAEYGACERCGTILGDLVVDGDGGEAVTKARSCPSPLCTGRTTLPTGADASLLYKARALVFSPQERREDGTEVGVILAVDPDEVHDKTLRRRSPVIARDVLWPVDRKRFMRMFDHHIHHESAPHITPLNDGWDASRKVPVL